MISAQSTNQSNVVYLFIFILVMLIMHGVCVGVFFKNTQYHIVQAFAWFSDLLVEHAEIFWSLFAVDMDRVLSEQPPDTWDSFPLFQILNDYLRTDGKS